jgi:hypothetical protein
MVLRKNELYMYIRKNENVIITNNFLENFLYISNKKLLEILKKNNIKYINSKHEFFNNDKTYIIIKLIDLKNVLKIINNKILLKLLKEIENKPNIYDFMIENDILITEKFINIHKSIILPYIYISESLVNEIFSNNKKISKIQEKINKFENKINIFLKILIVKKIKYLIKYNYIIIFLSDFQKIYNIDFYLEILDKFNDYIKNNYNKNVFAGNILDKKEDLSDEDASDEEVFDKDASDEEVFDKDASDEEVSDKSDNLFEEEVSDKSDNLFEEEVSDKIENTIISVNTPIDIKSFKDIVSIKDFNDNVSSNTKDTDSSIKDTNSSIKDTVSIKDTISIKDTARSKDTNSSIKDTVNSIKNTARSKDTNSSIKDTDSSIKNTDSSIKDTDSSIKDTDSSIKNTVSIKDIDSIKNTVGIKDTISIKDTASIKDTISNNKNFIENTEVVLSYSNVSKYINDEDINLIFNYANKNNINISKNLVKFWLYLDNVSELLVDQKLLDFLSYYHIVLDIFDENYDEKKKLLDEDTNFNIFEKMYQYYAQFFNNNIKLTSNKINGQKKYLKNIFTNYIKSLKNYNIKYIQIDYKHPRAKEFKEIQMYINNRADPRTLHSKRWIIMDIDSFKESMMLLNTPYADYIRRYYLNLEKLFYKYKIYMQNNYKMNKTYTNISELEHKIVTNINKLEDKINFNTNELERKISLLEKKISEKYDKSIESETSINKKSYIYIATSKNYELKDIYKIGQTINPASRLSTYNSGRIDKDKIYYKICVPVYDASIIEKVLLKQLERFKDNKSKEMVIIPYEYLEKIVLENIEEFNKKSEYIYNLEKKFNIY